MKTKLRPKGKKKNRHQEAIDHQIAIFKMATEARYKLAMQAYKAQDKKTRDALDLMVERLRTLSTGQIRIYPEGRTGPGYVVKIEPVQVDQNILFLATEILKDLALFDIQVANYEFPPVYCVECGEKLKPSKREKVKKRRA
jgi:hypothetical protein